MYNKISGTSKSSFCFSSRPGSLGLANFASLPPCSFLPSISGGWMSSPWKTPFCSGPSVFNPTYFSGVWQNSWGQTDIPEDKKIQMARQAGEEVGV